MKPAGADADASPRTPDLIYSRWIFPRSTLSDRLDPPPEDLPEKLASRMVHPVPEFAGRPIGSLKGEEVLLHERDGALPCSQRGTMF